MSVTGPHIAVLQALWGEEGQRNERAFAAGGGEGYGAWPDDMEGKELPGAACLLDA